jgi:hypothetical protein
MDEISSFTGANNIYLNDFYNMINDFISSFIIERWWSVMNTLDFIMMISCIISIAAIFYGNQLMKYFHLENQYPKIARLIQIRRRFQFDYLKFKFLFIWPIIFTSILN